MHRYLLGNLRRRYVCKCGPKSRANLNIASSRCGRCLMLAPYADIVGAPGHTTPSTNGGKCCAADLATLCERGYCADITHCACNPQHNGAKCLTPTTQDDPAADLPLVYCRSCPRSFHPHCHRPHIYKPQRTEFQCGVCHHRVNIDVQRDTQAKKLVGKATKTAE